MLKLLNENNESEPLAFVGPIAATQAEGSTTPTFVFRGTCTSSSLLAVNLILPVPGDWTFYCLPGGWWRWEPQR
jgi:hypothetical protein